MKVNGVSEQQVGLEEIWNPWRVQTEVDKTRDEKGVNIAFSCYWFVLYFILQMRVDEFLKFEIPTIRTKFDSAFVL